MIDYKRVLALLAVAYGAVFLITIALSDQNLYIGVGSGHSAKLYIAQEVNQDYEALSKEDFLLKLAENPQTIIQTPKILAGSQIKAFISSMKYNPFALLNAYPDPTPYTKNPEYNKTHFSLINDDDYCDKVDLYNLQHPENMFNKKNFFTDAKKSSVLKTRVINKIGKGFLTQIDKTMSKNLSETPLYHFDKKITAFHLTAYTFFKHHQIGKHYFCETQMVSHITNVSDLINKAQIAQKINEYSLVYKDKPQCFDKTTFSPMTYRLFVKNECEEFFNIINSKKYNESLKADPIQYILKLGSNAHRAEGVFLLDTNETKTLHADYDSGKNCGKIDKLLISQKYISNPLLLDNHNKFHMRVYLLIASANPFIVFFQDGYIRASIFPFDKFSEDRATHLTNLLAKDIAEARQENKKYHGMTPEEIDDYQIWTLDDLQSYLLEIGKITDLNWLDNYLRPALQKSFMHLVRMTGATFWKQHNAYELLGCDFMLDDNLGLWFIEANLSPQLDVSDPNIVARMLEDMYEIQYSYYRSRMRRVLDVISRMQREDVSDVVKNLDKWKKLYQDALKNRLEPEYKIKSTNSFKLVMDESLPGTKAYLDNLPQECLKTN